MPQEISLDWSGSVYQRSNGRDRASGAAAGQKFQDTFQHPFVHNPRPKAFLQGQNLPLCLDNQGFILAELSIILKGFLKVPSLRK